jgi:hypothetical protein
MEGKSMFRSIRWQHDAGRHDVLYDRLGRERPMVTMPGYRKGQHPHARAAARPGSATGR